MKQFWTFFIRPRPLVIWLLLLGLGGAIILLGILGHLQPILTFLDSDRLSFQAGGVRLSAYLILKGTLAIIVIFWLAGLLSSFGEKQIKNLRSLKARNKPLVTKVLQVIVYFIAFLIVLDILHIDLTALAVVGGAIGIGIGFGLQKITSNFISGLILLFEKSVNNDDLVELIDGTFGFIRHTGARYTLVETFSGKEVMIPNEDFITSQVVNWTYSNKRGRVDVSIGVAYGSDLDKAHELILEAAQEHPRCITDPAPACFLDAFADSSINFLLYFWVGDVTEGRAGPKSEVMFSIWRKFRDNGIEIPFPQQDVYIKSLPNNALPPSEALLSARAVVPQDTSTSTVPE